MAIAELDVEQLTAITPSEAIAAPSHWYKDAIIYQLHVRAFRDSNGDGIGDLRGLIEKLDYIQELGVTAIWMLPCFPSPLKDDGYDIADYMSIHPAYGTLEDFYLLLDEAHRRDLRVITELVMNHTSDQHAWFQRARRAAPGSRYRDWYVWSDTPEQYKEARVIFQDFEASNWTWDPVASAYFWHRFYSHQPDLNFDNPEVCEAMFGVIDYWLEMGVDGLRLDAVPYLFEREGTNCENLPETHAFLRDLRAHIDLKFQDRMLLAEANQWPEDAAAYFGDGDECHMNFHFPLMPRLFMAVQREDRFPILDILEQTPQLSPDCQWAIFLRNHDELTLEMVTDEERDYMYRTYALDSRARINLGIRRRLAPLMGNNRRKIELMNALLLSLPGTPIIYYGDEIGMGDNYYLGDRNGVRTPMQWSADRNAGFSRANPHGLYLPIIIEPEYHYEIRNVDVENANPHSLLWWTRRILDLRKRHHAFGLGSFTAVSADNPKVLAFLRETPNETLFVVANLSRFSQYTALDLSDYRGRTPQEIFGQTSFPPIEDRPYQITLGPHGFYWFCISCREKDRADGAPRDLPVFRGAGRFGELLKTRGKKALTDALRTYITHRGWFGGKGREVQRIEITDALNLSPAGAGHELQREIHCLVINISYAAGEPDTYVLPLLLLGEAAATELLVSHPNAGVLRILSPERGDLVLCDATWSGDFWRELLLFIRKQAKTSSAYGTLVGASMEAFDDLWHDELPAADLHIQGGHQSNTTATFGNRLILKLFRRITPGMNPEYEIGQRLTEHAHLAHVPRLAGAMEYHDSVGRNFTVAIGHEFVENARDAWTYTLDELGRFFENVQSRTAEGLIPRTDHLGGATINGAPTAPARTSVPPATASPLASPMSPSAWLRSEPPLSAQETVGAYLHSAELLGRRLGQLHVALANVTDDPAFTPEPFSRLYQRSLYQSMRAQARQTMEHLRDRFRHLDDEAREKASQVLQMERVIYERFADLIKNRFQAERIRCHGDFHLGQVLTTGKDFVIIDFEGEAERPVSERRIKASPLRDVAGMVRSFHYVSHAALRGQAITLLVEHAAATNQAWATFWYSWTSASFLRAYSSEIRECRFLPTDPEQLSTLFTAFLLEKALYELRDELNNRPDWVVVPIEGILQLLT